MRNIIYRIILIMACGITTGFVVYNHSTDINPPVSKEITLVAEGVRFNKNNPTIELSKGTKVQLKIVNAEKDPIVHNFTISGTNTKTATILKPGESETLEFQADKPGIYNYSCPLHPGMMDGKFIVK